MTSVKIEDLEMEMVKVLLTDVELCCLFSYSLNAPCASFVGTLFDPPHFLVCKDDHYPEFVAGIFDTLSIYPDFRQNKEWYNLIEEDNSNA